MLQFQMWVFTQPIISILNLNTVVCHTNQKCPILLNLLYSLLNNAVLYKSHQLLLCTFLWNIVSLMVANSINMQWRRKHRGWGGHGRPTFLNFKATPTPMISWQNICTHWANSYRYVPVTSTHIKIASNTPECFCFLLCLKDTMHLVSHYRYGGKICINLLCSGLFQFSIFLVSVLVWVLSTSNSQCYYFTMSKILLKTNACLITFSLWSLIIRCCHKLCHHLLCG